MPIRARALAACARALYALEPATWDVFARVVSHAQRLRYEDGALEYAGHLSLLARQQEGRYRTLAGFDPDNVAAQDELRRQELALLAAIEVFNHRLEDEALLALFEQGKVKVSYWGDFVALEPKCVHARYRLDWGEVVLQPPVESGRLRDAAMRFLKERGRDGFLTMEDVLRLTPRLRSSRQRLQ